MRSKSLSHIDEFDSLFDSPHRGRAVRQTRDVGTANVNKDRSENRLDEH
jgi:hypothetical protein